MLMAHQQFQTLSTVKDGAGGAHASASAFESSASHLPTSVLSATHVKVPRLALDVIHIPVFVLSGVKT